MGIEDRRTTLWEGTTSIRKLIEHLRIESKLLPLGMDPGYSTGVRLIHDGDENGSGSQWLRDRLFRDATCPRFCYNFIHLMATRVLARPNVQKKYPVIVSCAKIYSFSKRMMAAGPLRVLPRRDTGDVGQYLPYPFSNSLFSRTVWFPCNDFHTFWGIKGRFSTLSFSSTQPRAQATLKLPSGSWKASLQSGWRTEWNKI